MALAIEASSVKSATIAITGAGTAQRRESWLTLGPLDVLNRFHSDFTERLYENLGGQAVNELIVPPNFGIGTPITSYRLTRGAITEAIERSEGQHIRLSAHSLGAYIAVEYAHEHPDLDIEVDAWVGPFGQVNGLPGIGYLFAQRTKRIRSIREKMGDEAPRVTLIGSDGDRLIPPSSSLPDLPGVERILFTRDSESALSRGFYPIEVEDPPGHVSILNHPAALPLYEDITVRPRLLSVVEAEMRRLINYAGT